MAKSGKSIVTFTAGEWAPSKDARIDLEKAAAAMRTCKNMIVDRYGGVFRRPGLKYISTIKDFAAISYVSYSGSGTLYGKTEFAVSDPPRKYRNIVATGASATRWTPGGANDALRIWHQGRNYWVDGGAKTSRLGASQEAWNAGADMTFSSMGTVPSATPEWMGLGNAGGSSGGSAIDTIEDSDPNSSTGWNGIWQGSWVRAKTKKSFPITDISAISGEDGNSPGWQYVSDQLGSSTDSKRRTHLFVYAVAGTDVWTVWVRYGMGQKSVGSGPATSLYVKFASGDTIIPAFDSIEGTYLTGGSASSGSGTQYFWAKFAVPMDTAMRFRMNIAGELSEFVPPTFDYTPETTIITDQEQVDAGLSPHFYLPEATVGTEYIDEVAEYLINEDAPDTYLTSSGASGVTVGTEEWAQTSSFTGGITAESETAINYTMRTVKSSATLSGLTAGYTYPLTLTYQERDIGGANANSLQEVVNFTASSATEVYEHTVIAQVGRERKLLNVSQGAGVAPSTPATTRESGTIKWAGAVTDAGGAYTTADLDACDAFLASLIADSFNPNNLFYVLPMLGSDIIAASVPLIDPYSLGIADFSAGAAAFVDADFSRTAGLQGNGSSKIVKVPFNPGQLSSTGIISQGCDVREFDNSGTAGGVFSTYWNNGNNNIFGLRRSGTPSLVWSYGQVSVTTQAEYVAALVEPSHVVGTTRALNDKELYLNGVSVATNTNTSGSQWANTGDSDWPLMGDTLSGGLRYWAGRMGVAWWRNAGLTDTEVGYINDAVSALNTSISRT
jgi:hypothetical protein